MLLQCLISGVTARSFPITKCIFHVTKYFLIILKKTFHTDMCFIDIYKINIPTVTSVNICLILSFSLTEIWDQNWLCDNCSSYFSNIPLWVALRNIFRMLLIRLILQMFFGLLCSLFSYKNVHIFAPRGGSLIFCCCQTNDHLSLHDAEGTSKNEMKSFNETLVLAVEN